MDKMTTIFVSYKYTGEDKSELGKIMKVICEGLKKKGHNPYCTFWDNDLQAKAKKEIFKTAMYKIDNSDILLVFLNSDNKSEGMLMEVGYSMAKRKEIILLVRKEIKNTHLRELIEQVYEFNNLNDIKDVIKNI